MHCATWWIAQVVSSVGCLSVLKNVLSIFFVSRGATSKGADMLMVELNFESFHKILLSDKTKFLKSNAIRDPNLVADEFLHRKGFTASESRWRSVLWPVQLAKWNYGNLCRRHKC